MKAKIILIGSIIGMALATNALAQVTNKSGDFDAGPLQEMVNGSFMCKSADTLFEFYEKVPPVDQGRVKWGETFLNTNYRSGECWDIPPSSAYLTGFRYAEVKRADKKLPSVVIIPRIVISGRVGYVLPIALRMNLPDMVQAIQQKNKERGWPAIQIGDDPAED